MNSSNATAATLSLRVRQTASRIWWIIESRSAFLALTAMAVLPIADAVFRKIKQYSLPGVADYTAHATLWVAFIGASLAARSGSHLRLTTGRSVEAGRWRNLMRVLCNGLACAMALAFTVAAAQLVRLEWENPLLLAPGLPTWLGQLPMVVFMAAVAVHFLMRSQPTVRGRLLVAGCALALLSLGFVPVDLRPHLLYPALAALVLAVAAGAPLFVFMGGMALFLFFKDGIALSAVPGEAYRIVASPVLPTIPLFTLAGYVLAEGGASRRLVGLFRAVFGWMPGGIAVATVVLCAFFTTFTGASSVTILALGALLLPILTRAHYSERFSLGLITASGSVGLLFPPALPLILYGVVAATPIDRMFLGGLLPGALLVSLTALYGVYVFRRERVTPQPFSRRRFLAALNRAKWDLLLPVIIIGGIFGGITTLVEAAALTAVYAIVLECGIHRTLSFFRQLPRTVVGCAELIGGVLLILGCAFGLTSYLIDAEVPTMIFNAVKAMVHSRVVFLLVLNLFLVAVGCIMDIFSAIVVVVPILIPVATAYGIDPVHLGILFLVNLELGYLTPPVGLNLFFSAYRFNIPLPRLYRTVLPFLLLRIVVVALVTYVPFLSLWMLAD